MLPSHDKKDATAQQSATQRQVLPASEKKLIARVVTLHCSRPTHDWQPSSRNRRCNASATIVATGIANAPKANRTHADSPAPRGRENEPLRAISAEATRRATKPPERRSHQLPAPRQKTRATRSTSRQLVASPCPTRRRMAARTDRIRGAPVHTTQAPAKRPSGQPRDATEPHKQKQHACCWCSCASGLPGASRHS